MMTIIFSPLWNHIEFFVLGRGKLSSWQYAVSCGSEARQIEPHVLEDSYKYISASRVLVVAFFPVKGQDHVKTIVLLNICKTVIIIHIFHLLLGNENSKHLSIASINLLSRTKGLIIGVFKYLRLGLLWFWNTRIQASCVITSHTTQLPR